MERDVKGLKLCIIGVDFNSHAHVERDDGLENGTDFDTNFNSHAHVERDGCTRKLSFALCISTHTLTWSVTFNFTS